MKILLLAVLCFFCLEAALQPVKSIGKQRLNTRVSNVVNTTPAYSLQRLKLPFSSTEKNYYVSKVGHFYVLNGDIIVGNDLPKTMAVTINDKDYFWSDASIPIVIDQSIYDNNLGFIVHEALKEFNNRTELCLFPRTNQRDYIRIVFSTMLGSAAGLSSIGRQGGEQSLFLASTASKGTVMHELMHAAGFYHEQSREDRDKFVRIRSENLQAGVDNNFQIEQDAAPSGPYDFCSIMHYSATAFSKNNQPTIECLENGVVVPCPPCLGNRTTFSDGDINGIDWFNRVSRFPCQTAFPNPTVMPSRFAVGGPSANDAAMAAFRHRADRAAEAGFVGAYPNFHEARQGINMVGGTVFLRSGSSQWQDVPLADLGNPPLSDFAERMRATQRYATRNGFVGGFPNFHHADYGRGIVCGTVLIGNAAAEWRDVPLSELGNPPLDDIGARMRSANDYAFNNGYLGGFPTFFHADYGKGIVCGIILIKREAGEWRDVITIQGPR